MNPFAHWQLVFFIASEKKKSKRKGQNYFGGLDIANHNDMYIVEKEMATHSSILARRIPWTEKPGRLQSIGLQESDMT